MLATLGFLGFRNIHEMNSGGKLSWVVDQPCRRHMVRLETPDLLAGNEPHDCRRSGRLLPGCTFLSANLATACPPNNHVHRFHPFSDYVLQRIHQQRKIIRPFTFVGSCNMFVA